MAEHEAHSLLGWSYCVPGECPVMTLRGSETEAQCGDLATGVDYRQLSCAGLLPAAVSRETSMSGRLRLLGAVDQRGLWSGVSDRLLDGAVACQGSLRRAVPAPQEGLADGQRCHRLRCEAYRDPWGAAGRTGKFGPFEGLNFPLSALFETRLSLVALGAASRQPAHMTAMHCSTRTTLEPRGMFHVKRPSLSPNIRAERSTKGPDCWRRGRASAGVGIAMAHPLQAPSPAVRCNHADSAKLITEQSPTAETSTVHANRPRNL